MRRLQKTVLNAVAFMLCAAMLLGSALAVGETKFPDVPEDASYAMAVETLAKLGVFQGDGNGNFNPDNTITRAEVTVVICRLMGVEDRAQERTDSGFSDVPSSHWAAGYIAEAEELGVVSGYGNGKFGPSDPVTQEQMVKLLVCAWGYESDAVNNGGWPSGYISTAEKLGIIENARDISNAAASRSMVAEWSYNILYIDSFVEG